MHWLHRTLAALALGAALVLGSCVPKKSAQGPSSSGSGAEGVRAPQAPEITVTEPPVPPKATGNPFEGFSLFVDPESQAMLRANSLRNTAPARAAIIDRIAQQPQAVWFGEWNTDIYRAVEHFVTRAQKVGAVAVMIAYNIPYRDCGQYSAGGLDKADDYKVWIRKFQAGIGDRPAVVILEPDAIPQLDQCLDEAKQKERLELYNDAVKVLRMGAKTAVYIDSGHARWVEAEKMAERLELAGIEHAHGFSLNTSNYVSTEENLEYGKKISELLGGGVHFVIDTSRNGAGPAAADEWCNPPGRRVGKPPTTETGEPLADAFLWLKRPGESDGDCNGGPRAGVFWEERAIELAQ
jgi:endoglucanase